MQVVREFNARISVKRLYADLNSLGAHVAAKLGRFRSDERTLTDDLCDMFAIWAEATTVELQILDQREQSIFDALPDTDVQVVFRKTTAYEEADDGADLEFQVISPLGYKIALFQAKAYDPEDGLRVAGRDEWERLLHQLLDMKHYCPLAFLLVYLPSTLLHHGLQGFPSWEQGYMAHSGKERSSKFGTTVIAVDDLVDAANNWQLANPPVSVDTNGTCSPTGKSLGRLFLEMLCCSIGKWKSDDEESEQSLSRQARVKMEIDFSKGIDTTSFEMLVKKVMVVLQSGKVE